MSLRNFRCRYCGNNYYSKAARARHWRKFPHHESASARDRGAGLVVALLIAICLGGFNIDALAQPQTIETTREDAIEWTCEDAAGTILSNHTRQDKAQSACTNRALADPGTPYFFRPSAYRVVATPGGTGNVPGSAALTWVPTTQNSDGSPADIAGYRVLYWVAPAAASQVVYIADPTADSYTVSGLTPATWSFYVTAIDTQGRESAPSNTATKVVN